jgi:hypothetical protein
MYLQVRCRQYYILEVIYENLWPDNADPGDGVAFPVMNGVVNPFGALWEVPKAGTCKSYGTRIYTSRLWKS